MSFILRFICCASTKNIDKDEDKIEEKDDGMVSPRFGMPTNDASPNQKNPSANKDDSSHSGASACSTKSGQTFQKAMTHQQQGATTKKNSWDGATKFAADVKEGELNMKLEKQESNNNGTEAVQDANNVSLMSIQLEGGSPEDGVKREGSRSNNKDNALDFHKVRSENSIPPEKKTAIIKGGMTMQKLDRRNENKSRGLSEENIFQPRNLSKKGTKREVMNSTPIMKKAETLKQL